MKLAKAKEIIQTKDTYRVNFYKRRSWSDMRESGYTRDEDDYFPADDEPPFDNLQTAQKMAMEFAANTKGEYWDIHVYNLKTKQVIGMLLNPIHPPTAD